MHSTAYGIISAVLLAVAAGYAIYYGVKLYWWKTAAPKLRIELVQGDITTQHVDAIVNAAKSSLLGGGGVDGAIHKAGGPQILAECRALRVMGYPNGLAVGQAVATTAGRMPADWVIHTVGPRYDEIKNPGVLRKCYTSALKCADELGAESVAFPLISAGVYGWPVRDAIVQALTAIRQADTKVTLVRLVIFDAETFGTALEVAANAA